MTFCDYEADYFRSFAFSPDGRWLAGAGQYGAVVWHLATGGRIMSVPYDKPCEQVLTGLVAFDPTGELLAVGDGAAGVVRLHQVPGGRVETECRLPADSVLALAFSPDGRWLAASALVTSNAARVWALPSGEPMEFPGQRQPPWALAFDPQGEVLATGDGQLIRLWDLAHRCLLTKLIGHERSVMALAFSPDGHWLASGSSASGTDGGELLLWDVARLVRPEPADYQRLGSSLETLGCSPAPRSRFVPRIGSAVLWRHVLARQPTYRQRRSHGITFRGDLGRRDPAAPDRPGW